MLSAIFTSVADALLSYAIDKLDPAERIKSWLRLEPARLGFEKALARAYSAFARQYPEYTSSLFDQSFLSKEALPELSKLLTRDQHPDPALLARIWGQSIGAGADFTQRATKPAAYFLERLEAELKSEPALQAVFDSRALERLPKIEADIQKLAKELQRGLDEALKAASNYQKATVHIGGNVQDSVIITGDHNQLTINKYFYSGDFVSLDEYYIPPDGVFQRVRVDEFVGREWLTVKVDAFLNDPNHKSGAFLLIGDAGVGKTSFMAHLVKERRYLHLFAEQAPGQAMLQRAMQSLASQLVTRYQIDPYKDRDTLNALSVFPDFLERILRLAASTLTEGEKIVIVCDALDEAGTFPDHFVFGLPKELPDGVYFILSQRPVNVKLPNFEPLIEKLEAQGEGNLQDIEAYLSAVAKRPEIAGQIRSKEYSDEFFIRTLKEKSQGVWMYLHYIIKEIESGARAPLDLANLPTGLVGYYAEYWDAWRTGKRGKGEETWDELYAPLLTTLAAAQEAIPVDWLIQWAGVTAKPREVTRLLTEHWRAFITQKEVNGQETYTPYHLSFKDFITGRVDTSKLQPTQDNLVKDLASQTVEVHKHIVNAFEKECNGEWEKLVEQDYPRLHLTVHLNGAREYEKLRMMLTEGDDKIKWADAREKKEETYAGYLNDLTYVWDYAEREQNYALAIRCMLIENSIHSLAANIPPELLAELAKAGIWSYARCISIIRQKPNSWEQALSIEHLISNLPSGLFDEAFSVACNIEEEDSRAHALVNVLPHLPEKLKFQVLPVIKGIRSEFQRSNMLGSFGANLPDNLQRELFSIAVGIHDEQNRTYGLVKLFSNLSTGLRKKAISVIQEVQDDANRASALANIVQYLPENQKKNIIEESVEIISKIKDEAAQDYAWINLFQTLPGDFKLLILKETLTAARKIQNEHLNAMIQIIPYLKGDFNAEILLEVQFALSELQDKWSKVEAISELVPNILQEDQKTKLLQEALDNVPEIQDEIMRIHALMDLVPYLTEDLQSQVLGIIQNIKNDSLRATTLAKYSTYVGDNIKRQILQEALDIAVKVKDDFFRADTLVEIAPNLTVDLIIIVFYNICEIEYGYSRIKSLTALIPILPEDLKLQAIQLSLASAHNIKDDFNRIQLLHELATQLPDSFKPDSLGGGLEVADDFARSRFFASILSLFEGDLRTKALHEALSAARKIHSEEKQFFALTNLIPHLSSEFIESVLQESLIIGRQIDIGKYSNELIRLIPGLPEKLREQVLQEALTAARKIQDADHRARALFNLIPHLPNVFGAEVLQESLMAARNIQKANYRIYALTKLVPYFTEDIRKQIQNDAILSMYNIREDDSIDETLSRLVSHLPDNLILEVLSFAGNLQYESDRAASLAKISQHLPEKLKRQAIQESLVAVRKVVDPRDPSDEGERVRALLIVAPYLPNDYKSNALDIIFEIKSDDDRVYALAMLIPYLPKSLYEPLLVETLDNAHKIVSKHNRSRALISLIPYLQKETQITNLQKLIFLSDKNTINGVIRMWKEVEYKGLQEKLYLFIKFIANRDRDEGIQIVGALVPVLIHFSGREIAPELYRAIVDTARWWP